jgi:hypothetical protein
MLSIKELLARHAHELRPSDGDPGYIRHGGREYVGILHGVHPRPGKEFAAWLMPNVVDGKHEWWGPHNDTPGILVRSLRWDGKRAMWCARSAERASPVKGHSTRSG